MTGSFPLNSTFRGDRSYLHGTDVYDSIITLMCEENEVQQLNLTFHSRLLRQPDLVCGEADLVALRGDPAFRGEARIQTRLGKICAGLIESNRKVSERRPCNEKQVLATANIDIENRTATLNGSAEGSAIEQVVFLNKKLHLNALPQLGTQWVFARLDLKDKLLQHRNGVLSIRLAQVLGGRFTRSDIFWDDHRLGNIFFSLAA